MQALVSEKIDGKIRTQLKNLELPSLSAGEVLIKSEYSSLNYKDALAITGTGPIFKSLPMIGGIDVAGTVEKSNDPKVKVGDFVVVTGCGLGETHNGGYGQYVIENATNVVLRPSHLSSRESMIYGTAGFTAALCLERMIHNGQTPEMGPILVTGASGGVGQFAVRFFTEAGFQVHAVTGKHALASRLEQLGAKKVIFTSQLELGSRPLESICYGGIVDNVGGKTLAGLISHVQLWGNVACVGLAESAELHTTVMPMILRGVTLLGISSNNTPWPLRQKIWTRLGGDLKPENLESFVSQTVQLNDLLSAAQDMLARKTYGRTLVQHT